MENKTIFYRNIERGNLLKRKLFPFFMFSLLKWRPLNSLLWARWDVYFSNFEARLSMFFLLSASIQYIFSLQRFSFYAFFVCTLPPVVYRFYHKFSVILGPHSQKNEVPPCWQVFWNPWRTFMESKERSILVSCPPEWNSCPCSSYLTLCLCISLGTSP